MSASTDDKSVVDSSEATSAEEEDKLIRLEFGNLKGIDSNSPLRKMKCKKKVSKSQKGTNEDIIAQLHIALWPKNDLDLFVKLLEENPFARSSKFGMCKDTLLHRASRYGKTEAVRILLDYGAEVDEPNVNGQTPLHLACLGKAPKVVELLLEAGADYLSRNIEGDCSTHLAVKGGSLECLQLILDKFKNCNALKCKGAFGNSGLHYSAQCGRVAMTKFFIEKGFDVNDTNELTETPLHLAAGGYFNENGTEIVQLLLNAGAVLNATTAWGDTAAHYAAASGTYDNLVYLVEAGCSVAKSKALAIEGWKLCQKFNLSKDFEDCTKYNILQKVARSSCINKSTYLLDKMMKARIKIGSNSCKPYIGKIGRELAFYQQELNQQETEFFLLSKEFHKEMNNPDSALKLFLNYTPDALEHLFDLCISSFCDSEQVQGKVFFDFFLFCSPDETKGLLKEGTGELALPQILISNGKSHYLLHPVFETFMKLKWLRTYKVFLVFLFAYILYVLSVVGFSLAHFGQYEGFHGSGYDVWWIFLCVMSTWWSFALVKVMVEIILFVKAQKEDVSRDKTWKFMTKSNIFFAIAGIFKKILLAVFPFVLLYTSTSHDAKRYIAALNVVLACFELMLTFSKLPDVGIYIFMLQKVTLSILRFFATYVWHFLGYAIAFHIIMPKNGAFHSIQDSLIKVLTMLMGEYDFTDNFVNDDIFWLNKVLFVVFVIDMSIVLMNLVIGLAVSDVEAIRRDSNVQRLMHETFTVIYLEKVYQSLNSLPLIGKYFDGVRLINQKTCNFKHVVYLDLVDVADNTENSIIMDDGPCGINEKHPCPKTIMKSVVAVLKKRIQGNTIKRDPISEEIINELKSQNEALQKHLGDMDDQMKHLINLIQDLHAKMPSATQT